MSSGDIYAPTTKPYLKAWPVTPSDGVDLINPMSGNPLAARAVWVGTGGTIVCLPAGNDDAHPITFTNVPGGAVFSPCGMRRILATGTTAAQLIALV